MTWWNRSGCMATAMRLVTAPVPPLLLVHMVLCTLLALHARVIFWSLHTHAHVQLHLLQSYPSQEEHVGSVVGRAIGHTLNHTTQCKHLCGITSVTCMQHKCLWIEVMLSDPILDVPSCLLHTLRSETLLSGTLAAISPQPL